MTAAITIGTDVRFKLTVPGEIILKDKVADLTKAICDGVRGVAYVAFDVADTYWVGIRAYHVANAPGVIEQVECVVNDFVRRESLDCKVLGP